MRCPRCQTVNSTEAQPAQQHHLPSFHLPSFGGHQVTPAPQHQPQHHMPAAQPAQPAQQQQGYIDY